MEITEDNLFECIDDLAHYEEGKQLNVAEWRNWAKEHTEWELQPKGHKEWIENLSPEELIRFVQDNWDLEFSKPGEVEYENICRKIAKTTQVGDRNTFVFRDEGKIICVSQDDNAPESVIKYDSWKECFDYVFYSQLKEDIEDLGLAEVFTIDIHDNKEYYLNQKDYEFLTKDDPEFLETINGKAIDLENDLDKRRDFCNLSRDEFLESYSYLTVDDYDLTCLKYPKFEEEKEIMLYGYEEDVKLDYLFNKYHIHDWQDKAVTLADIQDKDFKDIQLQTNDPELWTSTSFNITAEDLDDFIEQLSNYGQEYDTSEDVQDWFENNDKPKRVEDLSWKESIREEFDNNKCLLINFSDEVQKWKEQSSEYKELKNMETFSCLNKDKFLDDLQHDRYSQLAKQKSPIDRAKSASKSNTTKDKNINKDER